MLRSEKSSAQNVLRLVELNIKGGYDKLLSEKFDMTLSAKRALKRVAALSASVFEGYAAIFDDGVLPKHDARKRSLRWVESVPHEIGHLFVFDPNGVIIGHSDPGMKGVSIGNLQDIKGRRIVEVMRADAIKGNGDFAVLFWKNSCEKEMSKKLGYFFSFSRWQWTVCAMMDFVNIEAEARKKKEELIEVLGKTLKNVKVAKTGGAFLFNGRGDMLIPPRDSGNQNYRQTRNVKTGNILLNDLMKAAGDNEHSIRYVASNPGKDRLMEANVRYFKALDWYVTVSVPVQEIHQPAKALVARQSYIIAAIFLGSLVAAYFLMSRVSRPLKKLAVYAKEIPLQDFTIENEDDSQLDDLQINSNDEVGHLAESFMTMKAELKKNIHEAMLTQSKYRTILENIKEGFFETDLTGRLTFFNRSICEMTGYNPEDLIGKHGRRCIKQKTFKSACRTFKQVYQTGESLEIRACEIIRKNGEKRVLELSVYLVKNQSEQPTGFRCVARDISERLKAEEEKQRLEGQLLHSQKMEALGTLAGGIAHDFNNVLTAVIGYSELVLQDQPEGNRSCRNLEEVLKAGMRAKDLVNQILTFSRQTEQELKPVMIGPIVKETINFLKASIPATIEIRRNIQTTSDIVFSDPTKIHQVLMNLCTNAVHAMWEKGGILQLTLTEVDMHPPDVGSRPDLAPGPYLKLTVTDTGHGIDRETMERIFDPYFTTKEKGKGTGLGLSVSLGIVKSHGGTILVGSEPDKGTTFDIYLPRMEKKVVGEELSKKPLPRGVERILFIDDEVSILEMGRQMLEGLGYDVVTQSAGLKALDRFRENPDRFDLVITDLAMPKMTGMELAKELIKIRPDIPIILCTGFNDELPGKGIESNGIRELLIKPLFMHDLAVTTRGVLDKHPRS